MGNFKNFGVVNSQRFVEEFNWNQKKFYTYLLTFNEYDGFFRIIRESSHEQALIGAKVLFNYSSNEEKITKYKVIGYAKNKNVEKENKRRVPK